MTAMGKLGAIRYGEYGDCHVFRFEGDVRTVALGGLDVALNFERFATGLVQRDSQGDLIFDLTAAEAIDSTHVGLIAHTAVAWHNHAILFSTRPEITKTLRTMRMDALVEIVESEPTHAEALGGLPDHGGGGNQDEVVYKAHKALAALSEENQARFQSVLDLTRPDKDDS
jgi:anti-anti-sigma regulatory factor